MPRFAWVALAVIVLAVTAMTSSVITVTVTSHPAQYAVTACHDPYAPAGTTGSVSAAGAMSAPYNGTGPGMLCGAFGHWVPLPR